jgi:hypothetical protein
MKRTIVSALHLDNGTLVCKGKSGRMYSVFKKQGDLDGACATYCVIMNLLILGTINGSDTEVGAKHSNPDTKRLFREFCEYHGMHREGQTYQMIQRMLKRSMGDVVQVKRRDTKNLSSVIVIAETIKDKDIPVIISITGHAMLAVGVEEDGGEVTKILCLDPSGDYMNHTNKRWNSEIQIIRDGRTSFKYVSRVGGLPPKDNDYTRLNDVLIITKKYNGN